MPRPSHIRAWHTHTYRFSGLPEIRRAYPLYPSAAAAVSAIREHRSLELENARCLPAWTTFVLGQQMADDSLPAYARTHLVYRGQSSINWPLMPTLYRRSETGTDPRAEVQSRRERCAHVVASIFRHPEIERAIPGATELSELQKEAVARHYGAPSELVDVTCEPEVAAVFATTDDTDSPVGCIYAFNLVELLSISGGSVARRIRGGIELALLPTGVTQIHYLEPNPPAAPKDQTATIRFSAGLSQKVRMAFSLVGVDNVARIRAQRGVFLSMAAMADADDGSQAQQLWHLIDVVTTKYVFRHAQGRYVSDDTAFDSRNLMPADDPVAHFLAE